jgi:hypothetical protein
VRTIDGHPSHKECITEENLQPEGFYHYAKITLSLTCENYSLIQHAKPIEVTQSPLQELTAKATRGIS